MADRPLGRMYLLHELLGAGPTGQVWSASVRDSGELVAVKVLREDLAIDAATVARLLRARTTLYELHDERLIQVRDVLAEDGSVAIVSDLAVEATLRERLDRSGPWPPANAVRLVVDVCRGLAHLHDVGLTHGGLKPENIFVVESIDSVRARLADYGVTPLTSGGGAAEELGPYSAPEVAAGEPVGPAADVYAAAVVLVELLVGHPPDPEETAGGALPAGVPGALRPVLLPALRRRADSRPAAHVLATELEQTLPSLVDIGPLNQPEENEADLGDARATEIGASGGATTGSQRRLRVGDQLGSRYVVGGYLGRGSSGEVWWADDLQGRERVAIKVLRSELVNDEQILNRFVRERQVLTDLQCEYLAGVRDFVVQDDVVAIVMDLIEGGDLRSFITVAGGPVERSTALELSAQVLEGLAVVHSAGIVHRDVKPENVLLRRTGGRWRAHLTDFGIAALTDPSALSLHTGIVGTPRYMAPELTEPGGAVPASDQYSVGVMLYEMLAGRVPFEGDHPMAVMRAHVETEPARIDRLSDADWAILRRLLAKSPSERFPSATDAAEALNAAVRRAESAQLTGAAGLPEEPTTVRTRARNAVRNRPVLALVVALLVVVFGAGAVWWLALRDEQSPSLTTRFTSSRLEPERIEPAEFKARTAAIAAAMAQPLDPSTLTNVRCGDASVDSTDAAGAAHVMTRYRLHLVAATERLPLPNEGVEAGREAWEALLRYARGSLDQAQAHYDFYLLGSQCSSAAANALEEGRASDADVVQARREFQAANRAWSAAGT